MTWWTHLLFFRKDLGEQNKEEPEKDNFFAYLSRALKSYLREYAIDILYVFLTIGTYVYYVFSIITFFFEKSLPNLFPQIVETLSEPYLGVLGVYVVVKEVERRKGKITKRSWGDLFATFWFFFLVAATLSTYLGYNETNEIYKTVVTNALAAMIIRIGVIVR